MSLTVFASSEKTFDIVDTHSFLRPVGLALNEAGAQEIASSRNVDYDYYDLEISIPHQTFFYKFYKNTLTGGKTLVLTVDAQSREAITPEVKIGSIPFI